MSIKDVAAELLEVVDSIPKKLPLLEFNDSALLKRLAEKSLALKTALAATPSVSDLEAKCRNLEDQLLGLMDGKKCSSVTVHGAEPYFSKELGVKRWKED